MPLLAAALLPLLPVVAEAPPAPVLAPEVPALAPLVLLAAPLFDMLLPPALPGVGSTAPDCPADVPGGWRPALSLSAGDPAAAYAPATPADMQPATNANMSFLISTSRKSGCRDSSMRPRTRGH
jgi:hypothetical protein